MLSKIFRAMFGLASKDSNATTSYRPDIEIAEKGPANVHPPKINDIAVWVRKQRTDGIPLQKIWRDLIARGKNGRDIETCMREAGKIEDILVERNLKGTEKENTGDMQGAIRLYEANIKDRFDGSHPYERLRIIYSGSGRYSDAIRVCEAYIQHGQDDPKLKEKYHQQIAKYREKDRELKP